MKVIGISVQTTNKNGQSAHDIGLLWHPFYADSDSIPNKISNDILAIYTDYESNFQGTYTTIIGCEVATIKEIPTGCVAREFPTENFKTFIAKEQMPQAIIAVWAEIWTQDKILNRKYTYDFEQYTEKSHNGENSEAEIFIATN